MRVIFHPTADAVVALNKFICEQGGNPHHCNGIGKVESHAFIDGNKRTGTLVAITFLNQHGMDLQYPLDGTKNINALADVIENCAAGSILKEQLMDWFEAHKIYLEE